MSLQNIHVFIGSSFSAEYALGWEKDGLCYHIFLSRPARELRKQIFDRPEFVVYKNPPNGVKYKDVENGYFPTRHLDLKAKQNWIDYQEAYNYAIEHKLFEVAEADRTAKNEAEHLESMQRQRTARLQKAGPALYDALHQILDCGHTFTRLEEIRQIARKAIEEADKA